MVFRIRMYNRKREVCFLSLFLDIQEKFRQISLVD